MFLALYSKPKSNRQPRLGCRQPWDPMAVSPFSVAQDKHHKLYPTSQMLSEASAEDVSHPSAVSAPQSCKGEEKKAHLGPAGARGGRGTNLLVRRRAFAEGGVLWMAAQDASLLHPLGCHSCTLFSRELSSLDV